MVQTNGSVPEHVYDYYLKNLVLGLLIQISTSLAKYADHMDIVDYYNKKLDWYFNVLISLDPNNNRNEKVVRMITQELNRISKEISTQSWYLGFDIVGIGLSAVTNSVTSVSGWVATRFNQWGVNELQDVVKEFGLFMILEGLEYKMTE